MKSYNGFSPNQRMKAQRWLNYHYDNGLLKRPTVCVACGQDKGIIDSHAEDYSEPFANGKTNEFPLCFCCHMMVHCRFTSPESWKMYKDLVARGFKVKAYFKRNFYAFKADFLERFEPKIEENSGSGNVAVLEKIENYFYGKENNQT